MDLGPKHVISQIWARIISKGLDSRNRCYNGNLDRSDRSSLLILGRRKVQDTTRAPIAQGGRAVSILGGFQDPTGSSPKQPGLTPELTFFEQEVGQGPPEVTSSLSYPVTLCHRNGTFCIHQSANIVCHWCLTQFLRLPALMQRYFSAGDMIHEI